MGRDRPSDDEVFDLEEETCFGHDVRSKGRRGEPAGSSVDVLYRTAVRFAPETIGVSPGSPTARFNRTDPAISDVILLPAAYALPGGMHVTRKDVSALVQ
jgi:hypothetical protein